MAAPPRLRDSDHNPSDVRRIEELEAANAQLAREIAVHRLAGRQQELPRIMYLNILGELVSSFAHEVSQPLTAIANYIRGCERHLVAADCNLDELRGVMQLVSTQVRRAGDILRYAKGFTPKGQDAERGLCDLNGLIQETLSSLEMTGQFKGVKLVLELDADLPQISIDKIQIEQVLINMVQNALDAMAEVENGKTGVLCIRTQKEGKHALRVLVVDQGTGLSGDFEINIFRPFYTTKKNGMGMGLPISSSIIEAHGGKLEATNNLTKGATFSFVLPL